MIHWSKTDKRDEVIRKLSNTRKKKFASGELKAWNKGKKGQTPWNKGLNKSDSRVMEYVDKGVKTRKMNGSYKQKSSTIEKIRYSIKSLIKRGGGNPFKEGKDNISWKGGKSFEPYTPAFNRKLKKLIKERDKYRCIICGCDWKRLCIHHIDYNKENCNPENLVTLCNSCHSKTNFNRESWINYFGGQR